MTNWKDHPAISRWAISVSAVEQRWKFDWTVQNGWSCRVLFCQPRGERKDICSLRKWRCFNLLWHCWDTVGTKGLDLLPPHKRLILLWTASLWDDYFFLSLTGSVNYWRSNIQHIKNKTQAYFITTLQTNTAIHLKLLSVRVVITESSSCFQLQLEL